MKLNATKGIYLDWNSYGRVHPDCLKAMNESWISNVNPQSKHRMGEYSRSTFELMIKNLLDIVDASGQKVIFTSSATEANNHVLRMFDNHFVSDIEHPSIRNFKNVHIIPVDNSGAINLTSLENQISSLKKTFIVSCILANHETGLINDLSSLVKLTRRYNGFIHTDAVQAVGRIKFSFNKLNVDYMTLASHKCGGPVGIAALIYNTNAPMHHFYA